MKMKIRHFIVVGILSVATVTQVQASNAPKVGEWGANEWNWTTEEWTGDERTYHRISSGT